MIRNYRDLFLTLYHQEELSTRLIREKRGVLVGLAVALIYSITASVINPISFPKLHLLLNWQAFLTTWLALSLGLGLAGAIVGWFTENSGAIVGGGALITGLILITVIAVYLSLQNKIQLLFVYFAVVLPIFGASVVLAWGLRWAILRISKITQETDVSSKKKRIRQLISLVILVGVIPGIFNRFDLTTLNVLTRITQTLQSTKIDFSSTFRFPEENVPEIERHLGMDFALYSRPSSQSVGFIEVTIYFKDGFTLTCIAPTNGELYMFASSCNEGGKLTKYQPLE